MSPYLNILPYTSTPRLAIRPHAFSTFARHTNPNIKPTFAKELKIQTTPYHPRTGILIIFIVNISRITTISHWRTQHFALFLIRFAVLVVGGGDTAHGGQPRLVSPPIGNNYIYTNSTHLKRAQTKKVFLSAFQFIVSQINLLGFFWSVCCFVAPQSRMNLKCTHFALFLIFYLHLTKFDKPN